MWGQDWPAEFGREGDPVEHKLSAAARAFKAHALGAAAVSKESGRPNRDPVQPRNGLVSPAVLGLADPAAAAQPPVAPDRDEDERGEADEESVLDVADVVAAQHGQQKHRRQRGRRCGSAGGSPSTSPTPRTAHLRRRTPVCRSTSVVATAAPHGGLTTADILAYAPFRGTARARRVMRHGNAVRGEGRVHHRRGAGPGPRARRPVRRRGRRHHRGGSVRPDRQRRVPDGDTRGSRRDGQPGREDGSPDRGRTRRRP